MKTALLFSGQATQYVGMGRHLYENYSASREVFEQADDALGENLTKLILNGPEQDLNLTVNTQPAVLTVSVAAWRLLAEREFVPTVCAGHSLGEYSALVAVGSLAFDDALRLVRRRGELMQNAVSKDQGAMIIVQRLEADLIQAACNEVEGYAAISVYNAPRLMAVSGERAAVESVAERLTAQRGIIRFLPVSAPFHCNLLASAAAGLRDELNQVKIATPSFPYINNVTADWTTQIDADRIKQLLVEQVVAPVKWEETIKLMLEIGIERFWHLGPGRSNLTHVKKQERKANVMTFDEADALEALLEGNLGE